MKRTREGDWRRAAIQPFAFLLLVAFAAFYVVAFAAWRFSEPRIIGFFNWAFYDG